MSPTLGPPDPKASPLKTPGYSRKKEDGQQTIQSNIQSPPSIGLLRSDLERFEDPTKTFNKIRGYIEGQSVFFLLLPSMRPIHLKVTIYLFVFEAVPKTGPGLTSVFSFHLKGNINLFLSLFPSDTVSQLDWKSKK